MLGKGEVCNVFPQGLTCLKLSDSSKAGKKGVRSESIM